MDCVKWSNGKLLSEEDSIHDQISVTLYNCDEVSGFQTGRLQLTSHRILWHDKNDQFCILEIHLSQIKSVELKQVQQLKPSGSLSNRNLRQEYPRILVKLDKPFENYNTITNSSTFPNSFVQFEFQFGGHNEFYEQINRQLMVKRWLKSPVDSKIAIENRIHNIGIGGIQRKIQDRLNQQDQQIQDSFKDLNILMNQAKEMVNLSQVIISKLNKTNLNNDENEDNEEMKRLKSYFLNMGIIDNPVTKQASGSKYYKALAMEIYNNFTKVISSHGGIMTLADVYCRLNRARGIAGLISVDDLLNACKELNKLDKELKYNVYKDLNLHVIEIKNSELNSSILKKVTDLVKDNESLSAYSLSKFLDCSLIVAKKHLLDAESLGMLCRDDTNMGLKFYYNLFLLK